MNPAPDQDFRVLLYAHVDLNVVDGSAFFVPGAAALLTSAPGVLVDVISAAPLRRAVVVEEALLNPRVKLVDPFKDGSLAARHPEMARASRMDEATAATVLEHYLDLAHYDVVLVRSTATAVALASRRPDIAPRLAVYLTGITSSDQAIPLGAMADVLMLHRAGATLLFQTPEMRDHVLASADGEMDEELLGVMSPAVPEEAAATLPRATGRGVSLVYTGKFAPAWNSVEILAGFKQAAMADAGLRLLVVGDHFKRPADWPTFPAEVKYLLQSHPRVSWLGAVTRAHARDLVAGSDVGVSWRHRSLDTSLELSTKVLEAGALGRPSILNPTAMHRRLFGDHYPLFASSMAEYVALLGSISRDRSAIVEAAAIAQSVAADFTYASVFRRVFPVLVRAAGRASGGEARGLGGAVMELAQSGRDHVVEGDRVTAWLRDPSDIATVLQRLRPGVAFEEVTRQGPFVAWREVQVPGTGPVIHELLPALLSGMTGAGGGGRTAPEHADRGLSFGPTGRVTLTSGSGDGRQTVDAAGPSEARDLPPASGRPSSVVAADLDRQLELNTRLSARYQALAGSRLGSAQLAYWRARARLRGSRARG